MANRPERIGKYEITDVIGEGGMGAVYKARDPRMHRTVAIKVIKGDFADNPELLRRFYHEAQAVGNLQHPNIVVVYDLGEEDGSPFLVMEYVDGVGLDKIIARRQSLSLVQKLGIVIEALNALHYAHQRNIVHRDVKPANVMVLKDDHIKLLDFGIARQGDIGQTKTNQLMGTMWYMSPEQLNGQIVDGRSDVFSAGIMLFELLAYTLPFSTTDMTYVVKRLRGDPPPSLSTYLQSYPAELDDIIARSLTLDREQRYSTAEEFAFELEHLEDRLKRDMVSHYVDQARESLARSDLAKARELLSEVVRLDTQNQTARQLLYEIQQTLQKSARNERKKQLRDQAEGALAAKQLDNAANLAEEAIKLDPNDTDLLNLREQIELSKARAQQVKKLLTLAKVAQQTGELAVAKKAVEDALKLDPQDTDARLIGSAVARLMVEYEKQHQIQQFLQAARREVEARQFTAAQENIANAKAIDAAYPEIAGLERMLNAGREQEARQRELAQLRSQVEQELNAGRARAARDVAASAMRKFPGEQDFVQLKSVAEAAIEKEERRAHIDERIATASRLIEGGEASRAFRLLKDVEREYPADKRLRESIEMAQQAVARETASREKQQLLQHARSAMRAKTFSEAIRLLEVGLVQFPEDSEIKDLLKTAREEFDLLSKKRQVEEVSKQAQDLLQSRAHTDAILLLERTAAQVSDPELLNLLQYARQEAAKFRAAVQEASNQATQMLHLGQHSEAVTFLEAQADKYGKNANFQVLLEQARKQAKEAERAKQRLRGNLLDARAKLRSQDIPGAEALLRVCELESANDAEVLALATEIDGEKKAAERRRAEAERLAQEKAVAERRRAEAERLAQEKAAAERRRAEAERLAQEKAAAERRRAEAERLEQEKAAAERRRAEAERLEQEKAAAERRRAEAERLAQEKAVAERREQAAVREREARAAAAPPASRPSFDNAGATILDGGSEGVSPSVLSPLDGAATSMSAAAFSESAAVSATQALGVRSAPAVDSAVLTPPPIEITPAPAPAPPKKEEPKKKRKEKAVEAPAVAAEAVITPLPEKPLESTPLALQTIVEEPRPVAPSRPPKPAQPLPVQPSDVQPPGSKRLIFIACGAVALIVLGVLLWLFLRGGSNSSFVGITGAPPGAVYQIGSQRGTVGPNGTAKVSVPPDNYKIDLDESGYEHFSQQVNVEKGKTTNIVVAMIHRPTSAVVKIIGPPGAKFSLGDISKTVGTDGTVEVETKPGTYTIEMDAPDYKHYSGSVTLELGNNEPLTPALVPSQAGNLGTLLVKANVDHFDVLVDGKLRSNSGKGQQVRVENLPEGPHKVLIKKSDYEEPKYQSVTIAAKKDQTALFTLKPRAPTDATLSVTVRPAGRIRIDDGSPITLPGGSYSGALSPGTHKVEASADGYQPQTKSVTAKAGEPVSLPFELQPNPAPPKPEPKPEPTITANASSDTIEQGNSATIRWNTQNATQVTLDGKSVDVSGQADVTPNRDTTYTLIAKGPGGEKTKAISIIVHPKPIVQKPPAPDDKPEIIAARDRWSSAYESLDQARLHAAFLNIPPKLADGIQNLNRENAKVSVSYSSCTEPKVAGDSAEMQCTETVTVVMDGHKAPPKPRRVALQFAKHGEKWTLSGLSSSN